MKNVSLLFLILLILASCAPEHPMEQKELGEWEMARVGEGGNYPATVPGCVHLDLLANDLIADPFYGENEKELQWIGESEWQYSCTFFSDSLILEKENLDLVFEGLDTYAQVFLNDSLILTSNNMFRTWRVDVKAVVHEGKNQLTVVFFPPGEINESKANELSYKLPDKRAFTRKSPYHFGWDWGPEFVTCGIWKPVHLDAWDAFRIEKVHIQHGPIDEVPLKVIHHMTVVSDREQSARVQVFDEDSGERVAFKNVDLIPGKNEIFLEAVIEDRKLWWPVSLGDQNMYTWRTKLVGGGILDEYLSSFGVREIKLIHEPDEYGESFYFSVNGLPVFMKGANYVPQDNFLTRVDTARYKQLIESVVDANMNMLRVWGGGFYENDIFYELCDKNGILVWQDFMFACNMYPGGDAFLENVRQEAIDNVSRLSNHPCIALWCGNNEIDEGWHNWGWQKSLAYSFEDSAKVWNDYLNVFHDILPNVVEAIDPGTAYWPSSPMTGWGRDEAYTRGDVHYWGVWWGEEPFSMYREKVGRFASEYGFQGIPPMETIEAFGGATHPTSNIQHPKPDVLEAHQKHPRGTELIQKYMEREYIVPENFEDYVYISQVLQAEGMGEAFYTHRIAQPYCMGTLYWQLNDCWPVTSWAGLDYYGRWKALHYHVKRAYSPIMVRAIEKDGDIFVFALNDHPSGQEVEMKIEVMDFDGKPVVQKEESLEFPPQSNQMIFSIPSHGKDSKNVVFIARLFRNGEELSNSFLYFVPDKEMQLKDPGVTFEISEDTSGIMISVHAGKLARQVFLEARGLEGRFSDNFFDMAAGETREILFLGDAGMKELKNRLKIKSIYDTYN